MSDLHPHPCNFRVHRYLDRGWGELAFEYRWDSTGSPEPRPSLECPDLAHCSLYEITHYTDDAPPSGTGLFTPANPPFVDWRFRNPTDGRTGPVGYEQFSAEQGWAWDRHKLGGEFILPDQEAVYTIVATQRYHFHCAVCGIDLPVSGPGAGPHRIVRTFAPHSAVEEAVRDVVSGRWRYSLQKHGICAWMDLDSRGYVADSANIGFGPYRYAANGIEAE